MDHVIRKRARKWPRAQESKASEKEKHLALQKHQRPGSSLSPVTEATYYATRSPMWKGKYLKEEKKKGREVSTCFGRGRRFTNSLVECSSAST